MTIFGNKRSACFGQALCAFLFIGTFLGLIGSLYIVEYYIEGTLGDEKTAMIVGARLLLITFVCIPIYPVGMVYGIRAIIRFHKLSRSKPYCCRWFTILMFSILVAPVPLSIPVVGIEAVRIIRNIFM